MKLKEPLFDVVAVNIKTNETRIMATEKTAENAEAIINMAVIRRGVDKEFHKAVPAEMRN